MRYDPRTGPDAAQWLQTDEDERVKLVNSWLMDSLDPTSDDVTPYAVVLTALETQIASADPAFVAETLDRLISEGLDRFAAVTSMANVLSRLLSDVIDRRTGPDMGEYQRSLSALDAEQIATGSFSGMHGPPPSLDSRIQDRLEVFAARHAGNGAMSFPGMAGLIFAMVCGPRVRLPSEWMPFVLGDASFTNEEEAREVTAALLALVNWTIDIVHFEECDPIPRDCRPASDAMANLQEDSRFSQWCQGWALGMVALEVDWSNALASDEQLDVFNVMVMTFSFFATRRSAEDIYSSLKKADRPASLEMLAAELLQLVPTASAELIELGREARDTLAEPPPPRVPVRSSKIGRNQPCPCGSGKKYKKCCGGPGQ